MVFVIAGVTPAVSVTDLPGRPCPACGAQGGLQQRRVDHKLSLFFVPLATVSRGAPFLACARCGWTSMVGPGGGSGWIGGGGSSGDEALGGPSPPALRHACPHCGTDAQAGWAFCPFCGSRF
jgi:hypothetical protein